MEPIIRKILKIFIAIPFIFFGANKILLFMDPLLPEGEKGILFLTTMFSTYLVKLVGTVEVLGASMLIIPKTSFLGALLLLPVTINVVLYHSFHDINGIAPGLVCFLINVYLLFKEKEKIQTLIRVT